MKLNLLLFLIIFCTLMAPHTASSDTGISSLDAMTGDIEDWWANCHGNLSSSTCLEDKEVSGFKTLCMKESNKPDCRSVTDFLVAKSRLGEAKKLLLRGRSALQKVFVQNSAYSYDPEQAWDTIAISDARSFAVGILPGCTSNNKGKLLFGSNLRPEVLELREQMQTYYERLSKIPCPRGQPTLVVIGQIHDSRPEFDSYTISSEGRFKTLGSALSTAPFQPETDEIASLLKSN